MKINPKNFYKRRLKKIPPYFVTLKMDWKNEHKIELLSRWIYQNCFGRFAFTDISDYHNSKEEVKHCTLVGFEEPSDLTLFALSGKSS
jgi:outer membrane receptor for ferrienterochelin and colicin